MRFHKGKETRFKRGHTAWNKGLSFKDEVCAKTPQNVQKWERCSNDLFSLAVSSTAQAGVLPCTLRPQKEVKVVEESIVTDTITGTRIFEVPQLLSCLSSFLAKHRNASPNCAVDLVFLQKGETLRGLCAEEVPACSKCHFSNGKYKMYTEVKADSISNGRRAGVLNVQLQTVLTKLPIGNAGVRMLLSGLGIPPPSSTGMQYMANKVAEKCLEVNQEQMHNNQALLQRVHELRKTCSTTDSEQDGIGICAESDVVYNNPPKGRAMSQPGTQAMCPLIERETDRKMVLWFSTVNKICPTSLKQRERGENAECPNHSGVCVSNWPENVPLGTVESHLAEENARHIKPGITLSHLVTDNDSGLISGTQKVFPNAVKQDCTVHVSRGQKRKMFSVKPSVSFMADVPAKDRIKNLSHLGRTIANRCSSELKKARQCTSDDNKFQEMVIKAKNNIINCFEGKHYRCRKQSFVCKGGKKDRMNVVKSLPNKVWLQLNDKDRKEIQSVIDYKLSPEMIKRQMKVMNTNKSEATHKRVLRSLPKSMQFSRTMSGRAHSAIHSASVGSGHSVVTINECMGATVSEDGKHHLKKIDCKASYESKRAKDANRYMRKRNSILRKCRLKKAYGLGYKTGQMHPSMRKEHPYSKNFI